MSDSAAIWALSALDVTGRVSACAREASLKDPNTVQTLEEQKELLVKFLELRAPEREPGA